MNHEWGWIENLYGFTVMVTMKCKRCGCSWSGPKDNWDERNPFKMVDCNFIISRDVMGE